MIIRAVCQTLAMFKANSLDWELDLAKALTQVSETEITFELNQGQMFQGGYGEMTADDVKVSQERYFTPAADGSLLHVLPFTLARAFSALAMGLARGIPLGCLAATRAGSVADRVLGLISITFISVPNLVVSITLLLIFSLAASSQCEPSA